MRFGLVVALMMALAVLGGTVAAFNNVGRSAKTHFDPVMP